MKPLMIALSFSFAALAAPAMALGVPGTNLIPSLTFPDQSAEPVTKGPTPSPK